MTSTMKLAFYAFLMHSATVAAAALRERNSEVEITRTVTLGPSAQATPYNWLAGAVSEYPIHPSCNYTERRQLKEGLEDAIALATHAMEHVLRFGNLSPFFNKYFGKAPTAEVIGWYVSGMA